MIDNIIPHSFKPINLKIYRGEIVWEEEGKAYFTMLSAHLVSIEETVIKKYTYWLIKLSEDNGTIYHLYFTLNSGVFANIIRLLVNCTTLGQISLKTAWNGHKNVVEVSNNGVLLKNLAPLPAIDSYHIYGHHQCNYKRRTDMVRIYVEKIKKIISNAAEAEKG